MNEVTIYDGTGRIVGTCSGSSAICNQYIINNQKPWVEGIYNGAEYYIENEIPVKKPIQPSIDYDFNYITKTWDLNLQRTEFRIKSNRKQLLQDSDWTDTVSAQTRLGETLYNAWQDYRQQLRDIPLQSGYPLDVIFPTPPQQ